MEVASETNPSATPSASASAASPSSNSALAAFEDASLYDESFMSALEDSAVTLAHELHSLNTRLSQGLTGALDTTAAHLNVHKFASETLAEQVAQSVQALHVLVDKCGQLNAEFARVKALHDQIKETKKLVQILYENVDKISRQKK